MFCQDKELQRGLNFIGLRAVIRQEREGIIPAAPEGTGKSITGDESAADTLALTV
jgi:hypothetical protein